MQSPPKNGHTNGDSEKPSNEHFSFDREPEDFDLESSSTRLGPKSFTGSKSYDDLDSKSYGSKSFETDSTNLGIGLKSYGSKLYDSESSNLGIGSKSYDLDSKKYNFSSNSFDLDSAPINLETPRRPYRQFLAQFTCFCFFSNQSTLQFHYLRQWFPTTVPRNTSVPQAGPKCSAIFLKL